MNSAVVEAEMDPNVKPAKTAAATTSPAPAKAAGPRNPPPRQDEPDLPLFEFTARWVTDLDELAALEPAWQRLSQTALESNSFYESWCLLPALQHLAGHDRPEVLIVEAPKRVFPAGPKVLCGLFPVVRRRSFYGLPVKAWELWRHMHCFLGTPLVRRDCARAVFEFFLQAAKDERAQVVHLPQISGDGPLHRILVESNAAAKRSVFTKDLQTRAEFRSAADADTFLKACLSRQKRQGIQRTERRLAETGTLATVWFAPGDDANKWADEFLKLEASGWKGREGTALGSDAEQAGFFRGLLQRGAAEGKLLLGKLSFDGRPIAMICNLMSDRGGYSFKIAYDETISDYSPGLLIELALIRELHARGVDWVDSCAASDHPMINHLWPARAIRQSLVIGTGARGGDLATAAMPLVRWLKDSLKKKTPIVSQHITTSHIEKE